MTESDARKRRDEESREITKRLLERKPMNWKCPECKMPLGSHAETCQAHGKPPQQKPVGLQGWICPVCGAGNSPYTSTCPCRPMYTKIGDTL